MRFSKASSSTIKWKGVYFDEPLDVHKSAIRALTPKTFFEKVEDWLNSQ